MLQDDDKSLEQEGEIFSPIDMYDGILDVKKYG